MLSKNSSSSAPISDRHHFLLLAYPVHSHINPALQLAHRLLRLDVKVTLATASSACHRITSQNNKHNDIDLVELPENFIKGFSHEEDEKEKDLVKLEIRQNCSAILAKVISTSNNNGWPITCSVYTPTVPWAMDVVQQLPMPTVLLWTQPAAVLVIYYYFFHGYRDAMLDLFGSKNSIELPGLPYLLEARDLPTFMRPVNNPHPWAIKLFKLQTNWIAAKENSSILINTFELLEPDALHAVQELNMIPIGPLIPRESDNIESQFDASDYVRWLDSRDDGTVIYVSFGSIWDLSNDQDEEIARALLDVGRPFLWIIKAPKKQNGEAEGEEKVTQIECLKELGQLGLIVPWCIQLEVLSHKSIGCFVTHCGWNSTLESLAAGVPMVGMPLWVEQVTNAKLIDEYWKCGVRTRGNENDLVERNEIRRCLELVMGDVRMRESAGKWKELAAGATIGNGPADENLRSFVAGLKNVSDQQHL